MSELYSIAINSINDNEVKCRIEVVHPDENYIPDEKNFALQILMEFYSNCKRGYIYKSNHQHYPISEEEGLILSETHPLKNVFDELTVLARGEEVVITEAEYNELSETFPPEISSWGMSDGVYTKTYQPRYPEFCEKANELVTSVILSNETNNPRPDGDYDADPKADLSFTVSDVNLLFHIREGSKWESAMFDFSIY